MYWYIDKQKFLTENKAYILKSSEIPIEVENSLVYYGHFLPSSCGVDLGRNEIYDKTLSPSEYHIKFQGEWLITDKNKFKDLYIKEINKVKNECLSLGFDYQGHRQKCRDKDISMLNSLIQSLSITKGTTKWYFSDDSYISLDYTTAKQLLLQGLSFVQSVYDTESYFKNIENPTELVVLSIFENKRKELQKIGGKLY